MRQHLGLVTLLVRDYDEAIDFFTVKLGFDLIEDNAQGELKRWVVVAPPGAGGARLLLARAADPVQLRQVGNQGGGRIFLFLMTDDFQRDHQRLAAAGVKFNEAPREEGYGIVAVFEDLYGNKWDLIQPNE